MAPSKKKVSKFTYKTRKRVAGANPPLSSPAPSPPPAAAAPATPQPAPPEAAPAPSFIGVEILPFCGTRPAGIAPSTPGKANNRPWTHKKITKSLSITPSVLQQLLTTCDTAYQPRSADDDVPVAKTALPFRWDSDTEHECALLCFDTDLVADLVRGRDLHDHANLNRFAYGLYHVAQSSKRRVAARAKAASAKMMSQKLDHLSDEVKRLEQEKATVVQVEELGTRVADVEGNATVAIEGLSARIANVEATSINTNTTVHEIKKFLERRGA